MKRLWNFPAGLPASAKIPPGTMTAHAFTADWLAEFTRRNV